MNSSPLSFKCRLCGMLMFGSDSSETDLALRISVQVIYWERAPRGDQKRVQKAAEGRKGGQEARLQFQEKSAS